MFGNSNKPLEDGSPRPAPEWSASESHVRRRLAWMEKNGRLRVNSHAELSGVGVRCADWSAIYGDDVPTLTQALRRAWSGAELEGFWALANA